MMDRSFSSDSRELQVIPGAMTLFSLSLATTDGSKSTNTSLHEHDLEKGTSMADFSAFTGMVAAFT